MARWDTVAIVGVGLIGGSIGLALKERRLARRVVGVGRSQSSLSKAKRLGAVDSTTTRLERGVADADLIVVCTPVASIADHVRQAAAHCADGALVTDAGSTKAAIVAAVDGQLKQGVGFVGSHPLAGSEKSGPQAARADLFHERIAVVTPTRRTKPAVESKISRFWTSLGARVVKMSPQAHDTAMAAISHLPHLVAATLSVATPNRDLPLAAAGWRDTTRVAAGDPALWQQIFHYNRSHILQSLGNFEQWLTKFRTALERDDPVQLVKLLESGKQKRDTVGS